MIARPVEGNFPQTNGDAFDKLDRVLALTETAMHSIASKHQLRETKFQRWRWDQPEIIMSWTPLRHYPTAGKNIRVHVEAERQDIFTCTFESNAWFDDRRTQESFIRFWDHFSVGSVFHVDSEALRSHEAQPFRRHLEKAYAAVSDSIEVRLSHAILISGDGEAREIRGSAVFGVDTITFQVSPFL